VSNYALPGLEARHNSSYWNHTSYIGFGPSAHSFLAPTGGRPAMRWSNVRSVGGWSGALRKGEAPLGSREELTAGELFEEGVFLGLRANGLDPARVEERCGVRFTDRQKATLDSLVEARLAVFDGNRYRLTPEGFVLCDEICARLLVP
jgi:oxygen-independent coproporphyrinogen III oxidase